MTRQATILTDAEFDNMVAVGNEFWLEFSALCERHVARAPAHLRDYYVMFLGEMTSIYGRKT